MSALRSRNAAVCFAQPDVKALGKKIRMAGPFSSTLESGKAAQCAADQVGKIMLPATQDGKEGSVVVTLSCGA